MKDWAQILSAILAALISGFLILGSLVITLVENAGDPSLGVNAAAGGTTGTVELPAVEGFTQTPAESPSPTAPAVQLPVPLPGTSIPPAVSTQKVSPGAGANIPLTATRVGALKTPNPEETLQAGESSVPGYPVSTELGVTPSAAPEK